MAEARTGGGDAVGQERWAGKAALRRWGDVGMGNQWERSRKFEN